MLADQKVDAVPSKSKRRGRKAKLAQPTAEEILAKARREARPSTPSERRTIEAAGQQLLPGHDDLPKHFGPSDTATEGAQHGNA